jgi:PAS domain S-box-containing protein
MLLRYARSIGSVAIGLLLAVSAESVMDPTTVFLGAVILAAWFGGLGPGLLAAVLALAAVEYYFIPPFHSFAPRIQQAPHLMAFAALAVLSAWGSAARKKAEDSLRDARDELDARVLARTLELTRAYDDLRESERRHRHIFQTTGVSIWEEDFSRVKAAVDDVKASGVRHFREYVRTSPQFVRDAMSLVRIVDVNEATLKLFGARSKDELVLSRHHVFAPAGDEVFAGELVAIAEGNSSFEGETVLQALDGSQIAVLVSMSFPPQDSAFDSVLMSIIDITDRKRAEEALEELAGRLIHAQEEERSRIGRELHDHISQTLGILTIKIDQLRAEPAIPSAVAGALDALREDTVEITEDVHRLSHRLHSSTLDYLGLVPALQKLVSEFSERHAIAIDFRHAPLPAPLPSEVALCLFRVAEEALANVAKHSYARTAHVSVNAAPDGIHLTVEDAGTGFDAARLEKGAGLGFVSMQERLRVFRGTVRVDSSPSRGTRVEAWIPAARAHAIVPSEADRV